MIKFNFALSALIISLMFLTACDSENSTNNNGTEAQGTGLAGSGIPVSLVVFRCSVDTNQICAMNTDGSEWRQLTSDSGLTKSHPKVNALGNVVYECSDGESADICVVNSDGTFLSLLTQNPIEEWDLEINDSAQVVYTCEIAGTRAFGICLITFDASEHRIYLDDVEGVNYREATINNKGQIAFICEAEDSEETDICVARWNGSGFGRITENDGYDFSPVINDEGQIAYICRKNSSPPDISYFEGNEVCSIDFDGNRKRHLTDNRFPDFEVDINNNGKIVYVCHQTADLQERHKSGEICTINFDGSGYRRMTHNDYGDHVPSINDAGLILYFCANSSAFGDVDSGELCAMHVDGREFGAITENSYQDSYPDLR
jgi:hypothetical protein